MRELVADGTDTSHIALAVLQLVRASIYVNCGAVLAESCGLGELRLVRPDGICATTSSLTLTSVDYVNLFHLTVTIPVVLLEVYVITLAINVIILSVCGKRTKCVRTYYVESDVELAKTLCREVVADRSLEVTLAKSLLVSNAIIESLRV